MIVFNLTCANDHRFEGWFSSAAEFDRQQQATLLSCPVCNSAQIAKALHAPYVNTGSAPRGREREAHGRDANGHYANVRNELTDFLDKLIASTEDVGEDFPEEARKIHYQETPERKIRGSASREEVKELRDEGIEVMALPIPRHRVGQTH